MERTKRLNGDDGDREFQFPEDVIQIIQSYLTGKEAAQTSAVSKSWYQAWLSRPDLNLVEREFRNLGGFWNFTRNTVQRYENSNLKIKTLNLELYIPDENSVANLNELITKVVKMGIEDINVRAPVVNFVLPYQILEAETLVRLSLNGAWIHKPPTERVPFSKLKSLILENVLMDGRSWFVGSDCLSLFHCLEDLTISNCVLSNPTKISITSLKCLSISVVKMASLKLLFDVPNIRKLKFAVSCLPSKLPDVCITTVSTDWESDISIQCLSACAYLDNSWPPALERFLSKFSGSKVSLGFVFNRGLRCSYNLENTGKLGPFVENLRLSLVSPSNHRIFLVDPADFERLLVVLLECCPPKFISLEHATEDHVKFICEELIQDGRSQRTKIQEICAMHGLRKVSLECFDATRAEWQPLPSRTWLSASQIRECRFRLEWLGENAPFHPATQLTTHVLNNEEPDIESQSSLSQATSDPSAHTTNSTFEDGSSSAPSTSHGSEVPLPPDGPNEDISVSHRSPA